MRTLSAISLALVFAAAGVFLLMPAMSNGGLLSGYEFFGLVAVGVLCVLIYYFVARLRVVRSSYVVWLQAVLVGLSAPFVVLIAPLAYCIAFRSGTSCV